MAILTAESAPITVIPEPRSSDRLVEQFRGQPRIEALIAALLRRADEIAAALEQLAAGRALDTAVGAQLDGIGRIVGRARGTMSDDEYRHWLRVQIRINRSDGTPEDILGILSLIVGDTPLILTEGSPGEIRITASEPLPPGVGAVMADVLQQVKPAGVRAWFEWSDAGIPAFCFADGSGAGFDEGALRAVGSE